MFFFPGYIDDQMLKEAVTEDFGVSVGLSCKLNSGHFSFSFMYGDVGLNPTFNDSALTAELHGSEHNIKLSV